MKKHFYLFLFLSLVGVYSNAQTPSKEEVKGHWSNLQQQYLKYLKDNYEFNCVGKEGQPAHAISDSAYGKIIDKYFSFAITDKENLAIGSFASLDVTNNETKLNLSITTRLSSPSFLTISSSLNVKDKGGSIFSNNSVNSGFSGNIKYSRRWGSKIYFYADSCTTFTKKFEMQSKLVQKSIERDYYKMMSLTEKLKDINFKIAKCDRPFSDLNNDITNGKECGELLEEKLKIEQELVSFSESETRREYFKKVVDSLANFEISKFSINGVSFNWWSISGGYGSESYDLFDKNRVKPDAPVFTQKHNRFKIGLELNRFFNLTNVYKGKTLLGRSGFLSLGLNWEYDNNVSDLKALKTPTMLITESNDTLRTSSETEKLVVYDGSGFLFKKFSSLSLSPRYLAYYSKKRIWGIDLFGNAKVNEALSGPLLNAGLGVVFNVPNSDATKSKISFEIFYKLVDITERLSSSKGSVIERNEIGITAAIPFQKFIL